MRIEAIDKMLIQCCNTTIHYQKHTEIKVEVQDTKINLIFRCGRVGQHLHGGDNQGNNRQNPTTMVSIGIKN